MLRTFNVRPKEIHTIPRKSKIEELIKDLGENVNLSGSIIDCAIEMLSEVDQKLSKFRSLEKADFSLYLSCKQNKVERTFQEITGFSGIPSKRLFQMESVLAYVTDIKPSCIAERTCTQLGLGFRDVQKIKLLADEIYQKGHQSPMSVLGAVILHYCNENHIHVRISKVSKIVGVSHSSLLRCKKKFL